ncbi:MAG: acyltransferase family protein [Polyangiaceae bacterium]
MSKPSGPSRARLPSLDGLRALSISLVLFGHLQGTAHFGRLPRWAQLEYGNIGVRVFFVISGYLITTLLLRELEKSGTISISEFYVRRAFRIFPAFYAYLAVVAVLGALGVVALRPGDILHASTYTTNYHYDRAWSLGHMWSLAVEEQFYLGWPLLLFLLGKRRGLFVALGVIVLAPVVRVATLHLHLGPQAGIGESFQTVADSIAAGCVLACVIGELEASPRYTAFQRSRAFVLVPLFALAVAVVSQHGSTTLSLAFGETCLNLSIALIIHYGIRHPESPAGRVLNLRPLVYVGTLSYSLYLWQQLFLNRSSTQWFAAFPLNIALAAACAVISFHFVEQPFLRWREARRR